MTEQSRDSRLDVIIRWVLRGLVTLTCGVLTFAGSLVIRDREYWVGEVVNDGMRITVLERRVDDLERHRAEDTERLLQALGRIERSLQVRP